jgi:hypothetical protein
VPDRWWVDFEALAGVLNKGSHHSGEERRILSIAASLGGCTPDGFSLGDALPGLDRERLALVVAGVAHAGGSHEHHDMTAARAASAAGQPADMSMLHGAPLPPLFPWPTTTDAQSRSQDRRLPAHVVPPEVFAGLR